MSIARFRVVGPGLDGARSATVEINRETGIVEVRPHRRRYSAAVTLAWVAEAVLWQRAKTVAAEKRAARRRGRAARP